MDLQTLIEFRNLIADIDDSSEIKKILSELIQKESDEMDEYYEPLKIWTDGSCIVQEKIGGWAIVSDKFEESGSKVETTNNEMELFAIYEAVKKYGEYDSIIIYSDSQYAVNTLTNWAYKWKANGWRKKDGIKNLKLIQDIFDIVEDNEKIIIKHVKGHDGDIMNEKADHLARSAAQSSKEVI